MTAAAALLVSAVLGASGVAQAQVKPTPYWASISQNEARMRVGPSLDYPSSWVYKRRYLPVRVVQVLGNWRKIADPDGTEGWMHVRLLADTATAMVTTPDGEMHKSASDASALLYRPEKGVVGRVSKCGNGWCLFDVGGKTGYMRITSLWGATN